MNKAYVLVVLAMVRMVAVGQVRIPGRVVPGVTEITYLAAAQKLATFVSQIGMGSQNASQTSVVLVERKVRAMRFWQFSGPKYRASVDSTSGRVTAFHNAERIDQRYRRKNRKNVVRFNEADAKRYVAALAMKLGVPTKAKITNWAYRPEGTVRDQDSSGAFGATFSIGGQPVATIACDMQDGVPLDIWIK